MGFRFRKSVTIFPGVKINFSKSGASLSIGRKGAHFNVNTSGRTSASVGIPGTGVSYSKTFTSGRKKKKTTGKTSSAKGKGKAEKPETAAEAAETQESGSVIDNIKNEVNEQFEHHTKELPWIFVGMAAIILVLLIALIVMLAMNIVSNKKAAQTAASAPAVTASAEAPDTGALDTGGTGTEAAAAQKYVVNTSTKKFHKPSCKHAKSSSNVKTMTTTRDSLIEEGYAPCGTCKP